MPLERKEVFIPLGTAGRDIKTDPKKVQAPSMLEIENGVITRFGEIRKRGGFDETAYATESGASQVISDVSTLIAHNEEILINAKHTDASSVESFGVFELSKEESKWINKGLTSSSNAIVPFSYSVKALSGPAQDPLTYNALRNPHFPDLDGNLDASPDYLCVAHEKGYRLFYDIIEASTKTIVSSSGTVTYPRRQPKVFRNPILSGAWDIITADGTNNNIRSTRVTFPYSVPAETVLSSTFATDGALAAIQPWDACQFTNGTDYFIAIVYKTTHAPARIGLEVLSYTPVTGALSSAYSTTFAIVPDIVSVQGLRNGSDYYLAIAQRNNGDHKLYTGLFNSTTLAAIWGGTWVEAAATPAAHTINKITMVHNGRSATATKTFYVLYEDYYTACPGNIEILNVRYSSGSPTASGTLYNQNLASRASSSGTHTLVLTKREFVPTINPDIQSAYYLVCVDDSSTALTPATVAVMLKDQLGRTNSDPGLLTADTWHLPKIFMNTFTESMYFPGVLDVVATNSNEYRQSLVLIDFYLSFEPLAHDKIQDTSIIASGGMLYQYDGKHFLNCGFLRYPYIYSVAKNGVGTHVPAGATQYKAVYEMIDGNGEIHRSAPSIAFNYTVPGGGEDLDVVVFCLGNGLNVQRADSRVTLFRLASDYVFHKVDSSWWNNGQSVTILDTTTDAELLDNEILYTESGEVENICPPGTDIITVDRDRAYVVDGDHRTRIWYSKRKVRGIGLEFSDLFTLDIPAGGGITALASMDGKRIVFKEGQIRYFAGDGPDSLGNGGFTEDYLISDEVGCVDRNSVLGVDAGIIFRSKRGYFLLTSSLQLQYIGAGAEDYKTYSVRSAVLDSVNNKALFFLSGSIVLAYDTLLNTWSKYTGLYGYDAAIDGSDQVIQVTSAGKLREFKSSSILDGSTPITLTIKTPWFNLAGIEGFQRIYWVHMLGEWVSSHSVNVHVYQNYNDSAAVETVTIASTSTVTPYQFRFKPAKQKCESIRFDIHDSDSVGMSARITDIGLTVGIKQGQVKLIPAKTV